MEILADVKQLAVEYFDLTQKPLGVTGEVAEVAAAETLGLELAPVRTEGYDATRSSGECVQIKSRRILDWKRPYAGRVGRIDLAKPFDTVVLVLLDERYEVVEIWEAKRDAVESRITAPGSKAQNERGSLGISQFRSIAERLRSA
jgi:hypothetical protein